MCTATRLDRESAGGIISSIGRLGSRNVGVDSFLSRRDSVCRHCDPAAIGKISSARAEVLGEISRSQELELELELKDVDVEVEEERAGGSWRGRGSGGNWCTKDEVKRRRTDKKTSEEADRIHGESQMCESNGRLSSLQRICYGWTVLIRLRDHRKSFPYAGFVM